MSRSHRFKNAIVLVILAVIGLPVPAEQWQEMEWPELMPPEDLEMLETMPQIEHTGDGPPQLPDAIMEGRVRTELDQTPIRIPGFVVPLTASPDQTITEFFLVPYYGACIHVPPPPPNQIIHVTYDDGFQIDALYNPIWIEGVLRTEAMSNDVAEASYSVTAESIEPYEEAPSL